MKTETVSHTPDTLYSCAINAIKESGAQNSEALTLYLDTFNSRMVDAECSNKGFQSCFSSMKEEIKHLKWILENAVATEEKHYESEETIPGWIAEAKEVTA